MLPFLHREAGEEDPVDPLGTAREKERTHGKTKKSRRERRHAERGAQSVTEASPSVAEQEQPMQVTNERGTY